MNSLLFLLHGTIIIECQYFKHVQTRPYRTLGFNFAFYKKIYNNKEMNVISEANRIHKLDILYHII